MHSHTASKFLEISVASIRKHAMNYQCTKMFQRHRVETWNDKLCQLSVQRKFLKVTELKVKNCVWKWILQRSSCWSQLTSSLLFYKHKKMDMCAFPVRTDYQLPITSCQIAQLHLQRYTCMETWQHFESPHLWTEEKFTHANKLFADLPTLRVVYNCPLTRHSWLK